MTSTTGLIAFQYIVLRCVPRVDREEFVNVGVVVYSQDADFLAVATNLDRDKLRAMSTLVDPDSVESALARIAEVCAGSDDTGPVGGATRRERFGWLVAPRSTVIQASAVHGGLTADVGAELQRLLATLVL
jgi:hypothetical protein